MKGEEQWQKRFERATFHAGCIHGVASLQRPGKRSGARKGTRRHPSKVRAICCENYINKFGNGRMKELGRMMPFADSITSSQVTAQPEAAQKKSQRSRRRNRLRENRGQELREGGARKMGRAYRRYCFA